MSTIILKRNESFEVALRRFRRLVERGGLLGEVRRRMSYEKPTTERKRKEAASKRRHSPHPKKK